MGYRKALKHQSTLASHHWITAPVTLQRAVFLCNMRTKPISVLCTLSPIFTPILKTHLPVFIFYLKI